MISTGARVALLIVLATTWVGCQEAPPPAPPDGQIQAQVTNALESNPATLNARNVWLNNVSVRNGVVTLAGSVPNAEAKAACEQVARTVSGVTGVTNNI